MVKVDDGYLTRLACWACHIVTSARRENFNSRTVGGVMGGHSNFFLLYRHTRCSSALFCAGGQSRMTRLSGLRSRWMMPRSCTCPIAYTSRSSEEISAEIRDFGF